MVSALILAAALVLATHAAHAADPLGTVGILEGVATVVRGTGRLHVVEGMKLEAGDIVHTGADTLLQVELGGETVVQLGPATNAMFENTSARGKPTQPWLYVMDGWVKLRGSAGARIDLRTPLVEVPSVPAVVVMRTSPTEVAMFVERGEARLVERAAKGPAGAPGTALTLAAGQLYQRKAGSARNVSSGALQAFTQGMPRSYRDSLPLRADRYAGRDVKPREAPPFAYDDVRAWIQAEPTLRRPFVKRWRAKAREPAFRSELIAHLNAHMEWDPVLFPEKYLPKPPVLPASASAQRWRSE
jgi:hypothetical protein